MHLYQNKLNGRLGKVGGEEGGRVKILWIHPTARLDDLLLREEVILEIIMIIKDQDSF